MKLKKAVAVLALAVVCIAPLRWARVAAAAPVGAVQTAPSIFYVSVKGKVQGDFKNEIIRKMPGPGRTFAQGYKFSFQLNSIHDTTTGQATGKRQYSPIIFTKEWGASSPQFLQALATNETLSTVTFEFMKTGPTGAEFVSETVTLTNASVSGIRRYIDIPNLNEAAHPHELEDISLVFQKIETTDTNGKTMAADDWMAIR
jgi:type VI secretion system secreted protein Hcp